MSIVIRQDKKSSILRKGYEYSHTLAASILASPFLINEYLSRPWANKLEATALLLIAGAIIYRFDRRIASYNIQERDEKQGQKIRV